MSEQNQKRAQEFKTVESFRVRYFPSATKQQALKANSLEFAKNTARQVAVDKDIDRK